METPSEAPVVERARSAVSRGAWQEALDLLQAAQAEGSLAPEALELLAQAAYGAGDLEAAITAWEQQHHALVEAGDPLGAAGTATTLAMYLMMDTGLMAPVRGWTARAERLLDGFAETPVHAYVAMVRTYERLMCGDMERAGHWAQQAIDIGTRQAAPAPAAVGRVATARLLIFAGRVEEGLQLLDEAAVVTVSGELDPLATGMVYCELICAMQGLAQYDRAEQWTDAMERWRQGNAFGGINGRCRVHRAEILRLRGSCEEAETEALRACEELRPWMRREFGWPLTELGTIRLRKGDLAGAEQAFLAAHENGWDPQPGLALVRLAQGEVAVAGALIDTALRHPSNVPSKERPPYGGLRRAPLLEAQVEIALAAGDLSSADHAADELSGIATSFRSEALEASAALARGRVALARADPQTAVQECGQAVTCWTEVGAPYEAAVARMGLAAALRACGAEERGLLEARAARSAFERIGAASRAEEAATWCCGGPDANRSATTTGPSAPPLRCVFRCGGDTRTVEFAGTSVLLRDLKGMRYLARLLAEPHREFHVLDLVATERGSLPRPGPSADRDLTVSVGGELGPAFDEQARLAYKRRLTEIEQDIEEAASMGDVDRVALAEADRDYLVRELSSAFGLGGRHRPTNSTSERARASVTRATHYAMTRIGEHHPALAEHLEHTLHTGTYCSYTPDPRTPISWEV